MTITRGNTTLTLKPGDQINTDDTIKTEAGSRAELTFADDTKMILAENTRLAVDSYVYDPTAKPGVVYQWFEGAFQWISGKLVDQEALRRQREIETEGLFGMTIRGTEFVAAMNATGNGAEIDLIEGQLDITPKVAKRDALFTAPVKIAVTATSATGAPLSRAEYEAAKARLAPSQGAGVPAL